MKNVFLLSTSEPSRLRYNLSGNLVHTKGVYHDYDANLNQHLYITSDEEIKAHDWCFFGFNLENDFEGGEDYEITHADLLKCTGLSKEGYLLHSGGITGRASCKKITLTTDPELINDGVQAIYDDFLEWFVKNPNCEFVDIKPYCEKITCKNNSCKTSCQELKFKIIIPKEEPKQETAEEAPERVFTPAYTNYKVRRQGFMEGANWAANRMYSEEDLLKAQQAILCNMKDAIMNDNYILEVLRRPKKQTKNNNQTQ
jgi:hypothetical protein